MRSRVSVANIIAEIDRKMYPEQYEAARLAAEKICPPQGPAFDASQLHPMQQAALLHMHESVVKRALVARLLQDSQDNFTFQDFHALEAFGLAEKKPFATWHSLTEQGLTAAKALEQKLCLSLDVHLLTPRGFVAHEERWACPCGFSTQVRRSPTARGNASAQHAKHVATAMGLSGLKLALKPQGMEG